MRLRDMARFRSLFWNALPTYCDPGVHTPFDHKEAPCNASSARS